MKRWALIIAGLYGLILGVLTIPAILAAFVPQVRGGEAAKVYAEWPYWLWLAVMVAGQFALLAIPVRVASRRPVTRGALWPSLLAGGLMMSGLAVGAACSLYELVARDKAEMNYLAWIAISLGVLTWAGWLLVFFRMSKTANATDLIARHSRWLLKGSILELLIAVPTHIVARYRGYCCAGFMTFIGLTMGVSVMLFAFGPAVFFLYVERWKRLHPEAQNRSTLGS